jgi:hypothetical protein
LAQFFRNQGVDGALIDHNAIGVTLQQMETVQEEQRPKSLTALIVGTYMGALKKVHSRKTPDDLDLSLILSYFRETTKWKTVMFQAFDFKSVFQQIDKPCALMEEEVKNPNYFFLYNLTGLPGHDGCTAEIMLSHDYSEECYNFKYQADTVGSIFVRQVTVVKNPLWGIQGGWDLSLYFTILDRNPSSDKWKLDVYGDDTASYTALVDFPVAATTGLTIDPFLAFAMMNYNAYKGYMARCALLWHRSDGKQMCNFCRHHPLDCRKWLPFTKKDKHKLFA